MAQNQHLQLRHFLPKAFFLRFEKKFEGGSFEPIHFLSKKIFAGSLSGSEPDILISLK